jgi:hypothetical protein
MWGKTDNTLRRHAQTKNATGDIFKALAEDVPP